MSELINAPTAARAAALWWAEQIGAPAFRMVDDSSSPDERATAFLGEALASIAASRHPVTEDAGARFVDALERIVHERSHYYMGGLHTDYGPDGALAAAAEEAGVNFSRFPWKTNMWIKEDYVYVSAGYGARMVLVWHAPGWQRPRCDNQHYAGNDPYDEVCGLPRYHEEPCGDWQPDDKRCETCGGTYSAHYSGEYYNDPDRCRWKAPS